MKGRAIGLREVQRILGKAVVQDARTEKGSRSEETVEAMKVRAQERRRKRAEKMNGSGIPVVDDRSKTQSEILDEFASHLRKGGADPRILTDDAVSGDPEIEGSQGPGFHNSGGGVSGTQEGTPSPEPGSH